MRFFFGGGWLTTYLVLELDMVPIIIIQPLEHYWRSVVNSVDSYIRQHRGGITPPLPCDDPGVLYHIVSGHGEALEHIPHPTLVMCLQAVRQEALALEFVPPHLKTLEMCRWCVQRWNASIQFVPDDMREIL
jgi:hypothetical protein